MKRRWLKISVAAAALALVSWLITLGVSIYNIATYYPEGIVEKEDVIFSFEVDTHRRGMGIPLLFMYWADHLPYTINVTASSSNLHLKSIYVRTVDIKFGSHNHFVTAASDRGEAFLPMMGVNRTPGASPGEIVFSDSPYARARLQFPALLSRRESVTLRFHCFLFYNDNTSKEIHFDKELNIRKERKIYSHRHYL